MGERRALVIASQCESLNLLSFLPEAAHDVADALLDPEVGACVPALADGRRLLVDPTMVQLDDAVTEAFERASEDEATLFIALVGHGDYADDDFYFLTKDTTDPANSRNSFLLAQRVKELLGRHSMLDGLVILLDTCHAGIAAQQAATRWIKIVGEAGKRFEVLTASDDRTAADGCFSRSLAKTLRAGRSELGERMRCPDLKRVVSGLCPTQTAVHLAFDGVRTVEKGDQGLWLARNNSEAWRPLLGNPAASEIERLTEGYVVPPELQRVIALLFTGTRCVQVRGVGADALIAALARPSVAEQYVPAKFLHAVLFMTAGQSVEQAAGELARQLRRSVEEFGPAEATYLESTDVTDQDAFERAVLGPLRTLGSGRTAAITLAVNVDTLVREDRLRLLGSLGKLTADPALQQVRLVLATRPDARVPGAEVVYLADDSDLPEDYDADYTPPPFTHPQQAADNPQNWGSQPAGPPVPNSGYQGQQPSPRQPTPPDLDDWWTAPDAPAADDWESTAKRRWGKTALEWAAVVAIVVAFDLLQLPWWSYLIVAGIALPFTIAAWPKPRVRAGERPDLATEPGPEPDLDFDLNFGFDLDDPAPSPREVVLTVLRPTHDRGPLPFTVLVAASRRLDGPDRPSTVRDVLAQLGDDVVRGMAGTPDERVQLARFSPYDFAASTAQHGVIADSIEEVAPVNGAPRDTPEHAYAETNLAEHLWRAHRYEEALRSLDDRPSDVPVENRERWKQWSNRVSAELGDHHRLAIVCRAREATWIGKSGDAAGALDRFEELLPTAETILSADDRELLSIRNNIAYQLMDLERFEEARAAFSALIPATLSALGAEDRETIHARHLFAVATGKCGDGEESLRLSRELLPDAERALGEDDIVEHIQHNLVYWGSEIGHPPPGLLATYHQLYAKKRRKLNDEHPDLLDLRFTGARLLAKSGQVAEALGEWNVQLGQAIEVLGERHPHVDKIREQLAFWGSAG